jgi:hypothetical protein
MKNINVFILAAIMSCATGAVHAQADYLAYAERVRSAVELTISAKSCQSAGMVIVTWRG